MITAHVATVASLAMPLRHRLPTSARRAARRLFPSRASSAGGGVEDPIEAYRRFVSEVEPRLLSVVRVHRFAAPVIVGKCDTLATPVLVGIETGYGSVAPTRASLGSQTVPPVAIHEGPAAALVAAAASDPLVLIRAGDTLAPCALERLGQALTLAPDARVITCDEDRIDTDGSRFDPCCRPGPSPDLALAVDLAGALLVVRREILVPLGAEVELGGRAWRQGVLLALAGPDGAGHAHVPMLLVHTPGAPEPVPTSDAAAVVERRLAEWNEDSARVELLPDGARRIRRTHEGPVPSVEAIVLFRDRPELLRRCVQSVLERSTYENLTLRLVDNGSVEPATSALVEDLSADDRVELMSDPRPFNFAALNNAAVADSAAEVVVFLNNDTAVLTPSWVEELLEEARRPEVGAVAPLLEYPAGSVQHAGAALGLHGYAGHPFAGLAPDEKTPFGAATDGTRNWLAVTAACMMVERRKFVEVDGFDERFIVAGNDVDLCLRLTAAGHRSLCVPHVRMLHDESQSRGTHVDPQDFASSELSYGSFRTVGDPFYNPNLTLSATTCAPRRPGE